MRLIITVCPREPGVALLALARGDRRRRLDAAGVAGALERLVEERGLGNRVVIRRACAGGCSLPGPNVSVALLPELRPDEPADNVAVGWRSYVGVLDTLDCLAAVVDDNLRAHGEPASRRRAVRSRRR